ncbi:hypothetical protein [Neorhizobium galegae]|nr:hypothetical protein [Neorhizobium galegae]
MFGQISSKEFADLSGDEICWLHLSRGRHFTKDHQILSTLQEAEGTMRHTNQFNHSKIFAPLLSSFAIWDQLGSCYADSRRPSYGESQSFKKGLFHFGLQRSSAGGGRPTAAEIDHLYMLRNGVVHDAAFTSHSRDETKWYIFRYDESIPSVVKLPTTPWDGQVSNISAATTTLVNRDRLVEMTSHGIEIVLDLLTNHRSDLAVLKNKAEIITKYLLWLPRQAAV